MLVVPDSLGPGIAEALELLHRLDQVRHATAVPAAGPLALADVVQQRSPDPGGGGETDGDLGHPDAVRPVAAG